MRGYGRGPRLTCPGCGRRGVTLRLSSEDCWACRYCPFAAFSRGYDRSDVLGRVALAAANPGAEVTEPHDEGFAAEFARADPQVAPASDLG